MDYRIRDSLSPRMTKVYGIAGVCALVAVWCALTYSGAVKPVFLPTPGGIWEGLMSFQSHHWLFPAIWRSFWRVARSLILVFLTGVPIGIAMGSFAQVDSFLLSIVNGAKSIPTTGIVGLIIIWFSIEE